MKTVLLISAMVLLHLSSGSENSCAVKYVEYMKAALERQHRKYGLVLWTHYSNTSKQSQIDLLRLVVEEKEMKMSMSEDLLKFDLNKITDKQTVTYIRRFLLILGESKLPTYKFVDYCNVIDDMFNTLVFSKVRSFHYPENQKSTMDIEEAMVLMSNPAELKETWFKAKDATRGVGSLYPRYVALKNEVAILNGFADAKEMWIAQLEFDNVLEKLHESWLMIEPFFKQLHAYVRYMLRKTFGPVIGKKGPISSHMLGCFNCENWRNLLWVFGRNYHSPMVKVLTEQTLKRKEMHLYTEQFITSVGMPALDPSIWNYSIFEYPEDNRTVVTFPGYSNLMDGKYRMVDCVTLTCLAFMPNVFHGIGRVHADSFYSYIREDEDMTDYLFATFISVAGPKLKFYAFLGLVPDNYTKEDEIQFLFQEAIDIFPLFIFSYILDLWRFGVFSGEITPNDYNCRWWDLNNKYLGLQPPMDRSSKDFDLSTKLSLVTDHRTIDQAISFLASYQIYKNLCFKVGEYIPGDPEKPLHRCSLYGKSELGEDFVKALKVGHGDSWLECSRLLSGQSDFGAGPLLEYFDPLFKWLNEENLKNEEYIGWEAPTRFCIKSE